MAVEVYKSKKQDEDPLGKLATVASIANSAYGMASKSGDQSEAMTRRLDDIKQSNSDAMSNSMFSDTPKPKPSRYGLGMKY